MKKVLTLTLACILVGVGSVWIGQGVGLIPGSFMTNRMEWAVIGALLLLAAGFLFRRGLNRNRGLIG